MISVKKLASAVGGKTARACDSCIKKRARWYCAADDAFLCQACDSSVHSANLLAGRHERVRVKTASSEQSSDQPSWHHGFKRKPRTPRIYNKSHGQRNPIHLVPDTGRDENLFEENDEQEQLLYRVPVYDSFAAQLWVSGNSNEGKTRIENEDVKYLSSTVHYDGNLQGFHQSKKDVEELTADVESLFGKGLDGEYFDMETLGFLDCRDKDLLESSRSTGTELKQEESDDGEAVMGNAEIDITGETFELNFDDHNSPGYYDEDNKARVNGATLVNLENQDSGMGNDDNSNENKKNILLALDYEGVIAAWADQKSPWITGGRPEVDPTDCWSDCMDVCEGNEYQRHGEMCGNNASARILEGGREARLSRYKEKRRNRLFSKKIRYEVRKLNAEKRPRMKGRFVKRESSAVNPSTNISFIDSTISGGARNYEEGGQNLHL